MSHQYFHYLGWYFDIDHAHRLIVSAPRETVGIDTARVAADFGLHPTAAESEGGIVAGLINVDQDHAMSVDLTEPLTVATIHDTAGYQSYLLIDGWHRLYKAAATHVPVLSAYILTFTEVLAISNLSTAAAAPERARGRDEGATRRTYS